MTHMRLVRAVACFAVAFVVTTQARLTLAAGQPADRILEKHGLKIAGSLALVAEEAEIKTKLTEARRLSKQLSYSLMRQQATLSPGELRQNIKNVGDQINQLRSEINAANQQMNSIPRYRGRFMNFDASALYNQLANYRAELQMEINQDSLFLNQLKSQPADPKARETIDAEVRDRRDAYHQIILDLRKLVDSAHEKYATLTQDVQVKKALEVLGHGLKDKPKLGPSHDFANNVKLIEKMERAESAGEAEPATPRSTRSRRGARTKNASKTAADAADF